MKHCHGWPGKEGVNDATAPYLEVPGMLIMKDVLQSIADSRIVVPQPFRRKP
jgi:hypothetical protein